MRMERGVSTYVVRRREGDNACQHTAPNRLLRVNEPPPPRERGTFKMAVGARDGVPVSNDSARRRDSTARRIIDFTRYRDYQ